MQVERENSGETQDLDMEAATAALSEELFGQGEDAGSTKEVSGEPGSESATGAETSDSQTPPAQATEKALEGEEVKSPEENSAEVQEVGAPKTWTKEALAEWAKIPPRAQQEIAKREEDFMRGISMYKDRAELGTRYDSVVEPYRAILAAENIDPVGLFNSFAANHYLLSRGTEEQKLQLAANLLNGYRIDLGQLATYIGEQSLTPPNPELDALKREVAELKGGVTRQSEAQAEAARQHFLGEINSFADDGQHPYFDEVVNDITAILSSGQAQTLQEAYDRAVWANPTTRQKEIDRVKAEGIAAREAEEKEKAQKRTRSMGDHVKAGQTSRSGTVPKGSMDDTLEETLREIQNRE